MVWRSETQNVWNWQPEVSNSKFLSLTLGKIGFSECSNNNTYPEMFPSFKEGISEQQT
jgi:hypothetical protein